MTNFFTKSFAFLAFGILVFPSIAFAQSTPNPNNPDLGETLQPATTTLPSASSPFGIDLTACRYTFKWEKVNPNDPNERNGYIEDAKANLLPSNPWTDQGCVTQKNLYTNGTLTKAKYADFESANNANIKAAFGNDLVQAISEQNLDTYSDTSTKLQDYPSYNRTQASSLTSIFNPEYLRGVYASYTGGKTPTTPYIPRIFYTGVDEFKTVSGSEIYYGGPCKIVDGVITVRTNYAGRGLGSAIFRDKGGNRVVIDTANPTKTCARAFDGDTAIRNANLQAYQFIYDRSYPTTAQCTKLGDIFNYGTEGCNAYYRRILGQRLNGVATGTRIQAISTYYATYDDGGNPAIGSDNSLTSFNWKSWVKADVAGPRQADTRPSVRAHDSYSTYVI